MTNQPKKYTAEPCFLDSDCGQLFTLFRGATGKRAVLFVPPFAEEMNKSRRMFSVLARRLCQKNIASLILDLYGTGDSAGDFAEAQWDIWSQNLGLACDSLRARGFERIDLMGLRMGALLAADFVRTRAPDYLGRLIFWQPVLNGEMMIKQFLRLRLAADMMSEASDKESMKDLLAVWASGEVLEVAGYGLSPQLYEQLKVTKLADFTPDICEGVFWFDVVSQVGMQAPAANSRLIAEWHEKGVNITAGTVVGEPFWSLQEITEVPELIDLTVDVYRAPE